MHSPRPRLPLGNDYDAVIEELVWWVIWWVMVMIRSFMAMMIDDGDDDDDEEDRGGGWWRWRRVVCTARDPPPLWSSLLSSLLSLHFGLHTFSLLSLWSPFFPFLSLFSSLSTRFLFYSWCPLIFHFILFLFGLFPFFLFCVCSFFLFFFAINATIVVRCAYVKEENFGVTFSIWSHMSINHLFLFISCLK